MGGDGSISQSELDALFSGGVGGLEPIDNLVTDNQKHVWIIKDLTTGGVCGGRCWTVWEAQTMLARAQKDYPDNRFEIRQIK